ncbi:MAG: HisA/HisF-related TIM barrel protein [Gemmatimonadales bacterium]
MELLPAIEVRSGRLIRSTGGDTPGRSGASIDPVARAEELVWQGAKWLHLVDLDRMFADGDNDALIGRIVTRVGSYVRIQLAGGLRGKEGLEAVRDLEVARFVVEAGALEERRIEPAVEMLGVTRVALGLTVRSGLVTQREWGAIEGLHASDVLRHAVGLGVRTAIHTDAARHGRLGGLDIAGAKALQNEGAGILVSGGAAGLQDIVAARAAGLAGVLVGRALDEGRFTLADGLRAASGD